MEIGEFVKARLDEDEAAANAGARRVGMPWRAEPQPGTPGGLVIDELGLVGSTGGRYAAEHIARHDPARVLREVATWRAILAEATMVADEPPQSLPGFQLALGFALQAKAREYSSHPDWRMDGRWGY